MKEIINTFLSRTNNDIVWKKSDLIEISTHYAFDKNDSIIVELLEDNLVECIHLYLDNKVSIDDLFIEYKENNIWTPLNKKYTDERSIDNGILIHINEEVRFSAIRIVKKDLSIMFKNIYLWKRKYQGLLVAGRGDAFGSRMTAFITCMYLARKINFKFGYVWRERFVSGNVFMCSDYTTFEKDFIYEHSYTMKLKNGDTNILCFSSIDELTKKPYKKSWGSYVMNYYIPNRKHITDLDMDDFQKEFSKIYFSLPYLRKYKQLLDSIQKKARDLGTFIAIHVRSGEMIHDKNYRSKIYADVFRKYVFPSEIAISTSIKYIQEGAKIIVFGADYITNEKLKIFINQNTEGDCLVCNDVQDKLDPVGKQLVDVTLMAYAKKIIGNHSTYTKLSSFLMNAELINFNTIYSAKEQYDLILNYIDFINTSDEQKSASITYAIVLADKLNIPIEKKISLVLQGLKYDINNSFYQIMLLSYFFHKKELQRANEYMKNVFITRDEDFFNTLFSKAFGVHQVYEKEIKLFLSIDDNRYPYINYLIARVASYMNNIVLSKKFCEYALQLESNNDLFLSLANKLNIINETEKKSKGAVDLVKNSKSISNYINKFKRFF